LRRGEGGKGEASTFPDCRLFSGKNTPGKKRGEKKRKGGILAKRCFSCIGLISRTHRGVEAACPLWREKGGGKRKKGGSLRCVGLPCLLNKGKTSFRVPMEGRRKRRGEKGSEDNNTYASEMERRKILSISSGEGEGGERGGAESLHLILTAGRERKVDAAHHNEERKGGKEDPKGWSHRGNSSWPAPVQGGGRERGDRSSCCAEGTHILRA